MGSNRSSTPLGIYVHIPFCERKCFYCDFYSLENQTQRKEFIASLLKEIEISSAKHPGISADTIFFGGGTPSLLEPCEIDEILKSLHKWFDISRDIELTMECNPGTVDTIHLREFRALGVNRISFGVQSFFDDELKFLQRIHTSAEAVEAVEKARNAGFENINIDLMYALPDQTFARHQANLERAAALETPHVSAYSLIVEPGTPLYSAVIRDEIHPAEDSTEASMYEFTMSFMQTRGYRHYEVSNYARPGYHCRHNLKYWNRQEYLGFGPSAHSYFEGRRSWNISSLKEYIASLNRGKSPTAASESLTHMQALDEYVFLQLRQGTLDLNLLHSEFSLGLDPEFLEQAVRAGYIIIEDKRVQLTDEGFTVCDEIAKVILSGVGNSSLSFGKSV